MRRLLPKLFDMSKIQVSVMLLVMCSGVAFTANAQDPSKPWTKFTKSLAAMHEQRMKTLDYTTSERVGGYGGMKADPNFYTEVKYTERASGRLLARVKTENSPPKLLHVIELFFYRTIVPKLILCSSDAITPPSCLQLLQKVHRFQGQG